MNPGFEAKGCYRVWGLAESLAKGLGLELSVPPLDSMTSEAPQ